MDLSMQRSFVQVMDYKGELQINGIKNEQNKIQLSKWRWTYPG